jgi:two-component system, chemotaxis family, protein-glutamate methylesterase/glutaminase
MGATISIPGGAASQTPRPQPSPDAIRVMVVDDSAVIRGLLARWLEECPSIRVVTTAANGAIAVRAAASQEFDVVVLDIEMPEMDGITALPLLLQAKPHLQVIMASTLTMRNADISMQALNLGAVDYIPKPQSTRLVTAGVDFRKELVEKVLAFGAVGRRKQGLKAPDLASLTGPAPEAHSPAPVLAPAPSALTPSIPAGARPAPVLLKPAIEPLALRPKSAGLQLAKPSAVKPAILAIGSSTGGPQALFKVLSGLPKPFRLPILITQHMPATFTAILAQHIERQTGHPASEAKDGEAMRCGHVYVAPGDFHMVLTGTADAPVLRLNQDPPENYCRPSVDPMFRSIGAIYGARVLAVVLTGMGQDGARGAAPLLNAGATVIAQDEATSVVWGMPGAVAQAGLASFILPIDAIAAKISALTDGRTA